MQDELQLAADSAAAECAADVAPCLLIAADRLADAAAAAAAAERERQQAAAASASGSGRRQGAADEPLVLSRRCVWFHHIKNLGKRKSIVQVGTLRMSCQGARACGFARALSCGEVQGHCLMAAKQPPAELSSLPLPMQWGGELRLGGWSKPGFPGVLLVEVGEAGQGWGCRAVPGALGAASKPLPHGLPPPAPSPHRHTPGRAPPSPPLPHALPSPAPSPTSAARPAGAHHPLALPHAPQGAAPDVAEYLARLRRLRWQAMAVRAEEDVPVGSHQVGWVGGRVGGWIGWGGLLR